MQTLYDDTRPPTSPPTFPTSSDLRELEAIAHIDTWTLSTTRPIHGTRP
jgi:hypothetical protein